MMSVVAISMRSSTRSLMLSVPRSPCSPGLAGADVRHHAGAGECGFDRHRLGARFDPPGVSCAEPRRQPDHRSPWQRRGLALGRSVAHESSAMRGVGVIIMELRELVRSEPPSNRRGDHRGIIDAVYADHVDVALMERPSPATAEMKQAA